MSRAAKAFLASSLVVTGVTVWGVHFIQAREEEVSFPIDLALSQLTFLVVRRCIKVS